MASFQRQGAGIRMELEAFEVELLHDLRDGIRDAIESPDSEDPAIQRLFPPVVHDDEVEDATARLAFHDSLLESRLVGLDALAELLGRGEARRGERLRIQLDDDEPALVLGVVNDLRLALAARIGMDRIRHRDLAEDDPRLPGLAVIDHLAWLQEQLLRLLDPAATAHQDDPDFVARVERGEDSA